MIMRTFHKASKYLIACFAALALVLAGCQDEAFFQASRPIEEGIPTRVSLGYAAQESVIETRAAQDEEYENRIENIYLFVFNSAGQRQPLLQNLDGTPRANNLFTFNGGLNPTDNNLSNGAGTLDFVCGSLQGAVIVGIANVSTASTGTAYGVTSAQLDGIQDLSTLQQFVMTMNSQSVYRGALFMMTGYAVDENGSNSIDIAGSESGTDELKCSIELRRTDAKVKFVVKTSPAETGWTEFSFLPKTWTVKRVPMQSYVLKAETGDYDDATATYFSTPAIPFEEITRNATDANLYDGGSFVFYMPENKKTPQKEIASTGDANADYAAREAWSDEDDKGDKKFTNANANSTYVEMTGTLSYKDDNNGQQVSADVRFTVHLGYASGNVNDYDTERNGYYTYTVTVRGIKDIICEVEIQNDRRPGYEGDVVYSSDQIFEFDSHYDRRLIKLNRTDIGTDMKWSVNTPFSRGIHDATDNDKNIEEQMRDYRWIKFAINADYGVDKDHFVKYPGDQNYNDPFPMDESNNNKPSPYYDQTSLYYGNKGNYPEARLLDVNQLIRRLQIEAAKADSPIFYTDETDGETKVAITVFVDEYLYFNHPLTNESGENNRSLWKLTADKEDRQLHIIAQGAQYSTDGNSSIVNSKFSFKQRTIRTIFNVDKEDLTTAWGLESTMETGRLSPAGVNNGSSTSNGRLNTLQCILGTNYATNKTVKWTDLLGTDDSYTLKGDQTAVRACLLRNRDLNGDNIIDANEVRWYLASIDQLTDIYLGEYALDEQSRLYPSNSADREGKVRWHYTSSSAYGNNSWILWAEEGASRGGSGGSIDDDGKTNTLFSYRCARNLGLPLDKPDELPADLVSVTEEADGNYLIDVTNMSVKARRTNYEVNRLPAHDERDADNRPYAKFRVYQGVYPEPQYSRVGSWWDGYSLSFTNAQNWLYFQTFEEYPEGYRIPNQREMLIMTTRMGSDDWPSYSVWGTSGKPYYICQTAFSLKGSSNISSPYTNLREGFLWDSSSNVFFLQNNQDEKGYVRPVQDVAE